MSVVAFTFGSLGDIVTLLQIANIVRKELCGLSGTSVEYHDLVIELDSIVYTVSSVLSTLSVPRSKRLEQSIENALYHSVGVSLYLLKEMNQRIFTWRRCDDGSVGAMMRGMWQRIGWTLFSKRELLDYRGRLSSQALAMNILLTLAQRSDLDCVGNQVTHLREETIEPFALIREIYRCVKNPPRRMGYTWEGEPDPGSAPIVFTDLLGHTITLPWELLSTRQRVHEFLLFYSRDKPGRGFINCRNYLTLVQQSNAHMISHRRSFHENDCPQDPDWTDRGPEPGCRLQVYATVTNWMPCCRFIRVLKRGEPPTFPIMMSLHVKDRKLGIPKSCARHPSIERLVSQAFPKSPVIHASGWVLPATSEQTEMNYPFWYYVPIPSSWMKVHSLNECHLALDKNTQISDYST